MKARVRFTITMKDGANGGRGSLLLPYSVQSEIPNEVVNRLRSSGILRLGEDVKLEILPLPDQSTPGQELAAVALIEGRRDETF